MFSSNEIPTSTPPPTSELPRQIPRIFGETSMASERVRCSNTHRSTSTQLGLSRQVELENSSTTATDPPTDAPVPLPMYPWSGSPLPGGQVQVPPTASSSKVRQPIPQPLSLSPTSLRSARRSLVNASWSPHRTPKTTTRKSDASSASRSPKMVVESYP